LARFRGSQVDLLRALLLTVKFARTSDDEFEFGPLSLKALVRDGFSVNPLPAELRVQLEGLRSLVED